MNVRDVCTRALRQIRVVAAGETPSAEDMALALDELNDLMGRLPAMGVPLLDLDHREDRALDDEFRFFVPPPELTGATLAVATYVSDWNATTNAPSLASSVGTEGHVYAVATGGSTALDDVTSWSAGDYAVFDGQKWRKSLSTESRRFEGGIISLLAQALCDSFGKEPTAALQMASRDALMLLHARFVIVDQAMVDTTIRHLPSVRYRGVLVGG